MSAFLCSVISDSFNLSISSQQLAAAPLNDEDTELHTMIHHNNLSADISRTTTTIVVHIVDAVD